MKKIHIFLIIVICLVLIFWIFYYKNSLNGNNIIKQNQEEIIESILNNKILYNAKIKVKIYSNKNYHEYIMKQEENENKSYLEVISEGDISGLIIENNNDKLIIKNSKLNLEKIYENYNSIMNNCLFLSSFSEEYKESEDVKKYEENEDIVIIIKIKNSNKYIKYKELYLDKNTGIPKKLIVKNSYKQIIVCIEYTNIEIM